MTLATATIWIIDDEAAIRVLLSDFLVSQGYEVKCFSSAVDALKALHKQEIPSLVLSDIRMNPMTGISFLRIAKRDFPRLPILLFTGDGSPEGKGEALKLGASYYLTKPFSLTELKEKLELCLSGLGSPSTKNSP